MKPEWIEVNERLPEDGQLVIVGWKGYRLIRAHIQYLVKEDAWWDTVIANYISVSAPPTHWTELPLGPGVIE